MNLPAEINTIPQLIRHTVTEIHPETKTFLKFKAGDNWTDITYKEALAKIDAISAWFLKVGIQKGDRLALIIENGPDYIYYDQALQQIGAVNTSVYPTLNEMEVEYILKDSGAKTIITGSPFLFRKIAKIANNCPDLHYIIPAFNDHEQQLGKLLLDATVISFQNLIKAGKLLVEQYAPAIHTARAAILPTDLSCLIYTSGTTGTPKGVMLTHHNLCENVRVCLIQIPVIDSDDLFLSFLPLSHVFERTATYHICLAAGCQIAFAQSLELLAKNMAEVKPTVMNCVPRLLERIHDKAIKGGTENGGLKAKLFLWALKAGKHYRKANEAGIKPSLVLSFKFRLADKLVFSKIKAKTGGKLKFMISGGGALPKNIGEFFGDLGIKILEGFGLTETSPVMSVTENDRQVYGTVGRIIPGIAVAIQNHETREIYTIQTHQSFKPDFESPEGEIIVRGHCVMEGYWNKPEETAATIDHDGWFHTGDIGRYYKGNLQITDRLKNMLVNAYGKNIYPTPVENTYLKSPRIEGVFLVGDKRAHITAIIIPSKENLQIDFNLQEAFFQEIDPFINDEQIYVGILRRVTMLFRGKRSMYLAGGRVQQMLS